jgi:hypothetical protein
MIRGILGWLLQALSTGMLQLGYGSGFRLLVDVWVKRSLICHGMLQRCNRSFCLFSVL